MPATISLNLLERVEVAAPCPARWEEMRGDDKVRFCGQCRLNVYNLSAMTRAEGEALIAGATGRLCARLYRRADGTVITRDCPVGISALRERLTRLKTRAVAAVGLVLSGGILLGAAVRTNPGSRLRDLQPFAALRELLSPAAPPATPTPPRMLQGEVYVPPVNAK